MFSIRLAWLFLILLGTATSASGYNLAPEDGLWWNPSESGRGWTLETQNNVTVVTHYTYRPDGSSTFFTSSGVWDAPTATLIAPVFTAVGGQCVGCSYIRPSTQNQGNAQFRFFTRYSGQVTYPNGTVIPIWRYQFLHTDPKAYLKGMWATTWADSNANSYSHFLQLDTNCSTCGTANPYSVIGRITVTESFGRVVVAQLIPNSGNQFLVLIDAEPNYWDFYYVAGEKDGWRGYACTRLKTAAPPSGVADCPGVMFALRILPEAGLSPLAKVTPSQLASGKRHAAAAAKASVEVPVEWQGLDASWDELVDAANAK